MSETIYFVKHMSLESEPTWSAANGNPSTRRATPTQPSRDRRARPSSSRTPHRERPPTVDDAREVVVTTLESEATLRMRDWIEQNRLRVDEASGGRIGYVYGRAGQG